MRGVTQNFFSLKKTIFFYFEFFCAQNLKRWTKKRKKKQPNFGQVVRDTQKLVQQKKVQKYF